MTKAAQTSSLSSVFVFMCFMFCLLQGGEEYDVYINEPTPLEEGEEKHTISVFVADEAGIINRVAGVFARRGEVPRSTPCHAMLFVMHIFV
jgi:hypothetical protein